MGTRVFCSASMQCVPFWPKVYYLSKYFHLSLPVCKSLLSESEHKANVPLYLLMKIRRGSRKCTVQKAGERGTASSVAVPSGCSAMVAVLHRRRAHCSVVVVASACSVQRMK